MSRAMLHGLGDCTAVHHCGCLDGRTVTTLLPGISHEGVDLVIDPEPLIGTTLPLCEAPGRNDQPAGRVIVDGARTTENGSLELVLRAERGVSLPVFAALAPTCGAEVVLHAWTNPLRGRQRTMRLRALWPATDDPTPVTPEQALTRAEGRPAGAGDHWLLFDRERRVTGCHCGFRADLDSDDGWGDSVVAHLLDAGARGHVRAEEERDRLAALLSGHLSRLRRAMIQLEKDGVSRRDLEVVVPSSWPTKFDDAMVFRLPVRRADVADDPVDEPTVRPVPSYRAPRFVG